MRGCASKARWCGCPGTALYALPRYAECKAVLRDDKSFVSGDGVALNPFTNRLSRGTTLTSDGVEHDQRRKLVAHRMLPRALRAISDNVDGLAADVVTAALERGEVDGVDDLASALPHAVVPDLVGWPRDERDNLLRWGAATFDILGPLNKRAVRSAPASLQMLRFAKRVVRERSVIEGSMAHELLIAADAGKLSHAECAPLMIDYIAPSLDTTISAISSALYLFATYPEQWQILKEDPSLINNAVNEVVRFEAPLRAFARHTRCDAQIAGVGIPAGARVLVDLRVRQPRRTRMGRPGHLRHPPRRQPPSRFRAGGACVCRPEPGAAGNVGDAARPARPRRPDRTDGEADVGAQQHHPAS